MRAFCWTCHRPSVSCFCALVRPFAASADFAVIVHPNEVNSTVGTAWILRRSILNLRWIRSNGDDLDRDPNFLELIHTADTVPLLLFPGKQSLNLNLATDQEWQKAVPETCRPLFIVIDGTWSEARGILRKSAILKTLPRVSFQTERLSEYEFKKQPHPSCLSSVESVHQVMEALALRGWGALPSLREHDQMIAIFRMMIQFQLLQGKLGLSRRLLSEEKQAGSSPHDAFLLKDHPPVDSKRSRAQDPS